MASSRNHIEDYLSHCRQEYAPKTIESYGRDLTLFLEFLREEDLHLRRVTSHIVKKFLQALIDKGQRADRIHTVLNNLFEFLEDQGWPSNRSRVVRISYSQWYTVRFLTAEQKEKYLQSLPRYQGDEEGLLERAIIEVLFATGVKTGELTNLEVKNISHDDCSITIKGKKENRTVSIGEVARDAIADYRHQLKSSVNYGPELFQGLKNRGKGISGEVVGRIVRKYGEKIGLPNVTPSGIRHTVRQHLIDQGTDDQQLKAILGSSLKPLRAVPYEQDPSAEVDTFKEVQPKRLPIGLRARKNFIGTLTPNERIVPLIDELAHKLGKSHSEIVESAVRVLYEIRSNSDLPGLEFGPVRLRIKRSDKPNTNFYLTNDAAQSIYELSRHWGIEFKDILGWAIVDKYKIEIGDT